MITSHDIDRGAHQESSLASRGLFLFLLDGQGQLGVDVTAIVARAVGQLGIAALGTADVMDGLQGVMRAAFALAHLADSLDRLHDRAPVLYRKPLLRRLSLLC